MGLAVSYKRGKPVNGYVRETPARRGESPGEGKEPDVVPRVSGDTSPCRMTGVTLKRHEDPACVLVRAKACWVKR